MTSRPLPRPLCLRHLLALGLMLAGTLPGFAEDALIAPGDAEAFASILRETGPASVERGEDGTVHISGSLDQVPWQLFLVPCEPAAPECMELNFYAGFAGVKPAFDAINEFNRTHRFGRAYLDSDLDAVIEMDAGVWGGISPAQFRATLGTWTKTLQAFMASIITMDR